MITAKLTNDWTDLLAKEFDSPYYTNLRNFLSAEYKNNIIFPAEHEIFNALNYTSFQQVKVVILGQDPYHGAGQAHGLSFSVQPNVKQPPSLKNIFRELENDLGYAPPSHGCLIEWAKQGVLLLNTVLTVRKGEAHSHRGEGWEIFTDRIISALNQKEDSIVYMLWGSAAQKKQALIDTNKHYILKAPHPSPLSAYRGFFGSKPFSKANEILENNGKTKINWELK
ncbi:uracil-DNA glycosylase [Virgibacillus sp. W0430]|uniref:uracil-DNA glycosylase n=1 Tax=Virgibacillus sp. W0430 TaxID=3391580 RepID=UPI003F478328